MARPRIWVNEQGRKTKQPTGVSKMPDGRFYIINNQGKRSYFKAWESARAAFVAAEQDRLSVESMLPRAEVDARIWVRTAALLDKMIAEGQVSPTTVINVPDAAEQIMNGRETHEELCTRLDRLADEAGIPSYRIQDGAIRREKHPDKSIPRLSEVLCDWVEAKTSSGVGAQHRCETEVRFKEFINATKDKQISKLTDEDFTAHYDRLKRDARKRGNPNRWYMERAKAVRGVIAYVRRRRPSWSWPGGVIEWADSFDKRPVTSDKSNREPLPVAAFRELLAACDTWAAIDVDAMPKSTQAEKAARHQATNRRRNGYQFAAMLRLACNCALGNIDLTRVKWANLKLEAEIPHLDLPRLKTANTKGAIERLIPLLPATIAALEKWRAFEVASSDHVFRTRHGTPMKPDRLSNTFDALRTEAGVSSDWQFKHIRNIAPSVGKRTKRPADERETILGHRCGGTRAFYEGDTDASYLLPLVQAVGDAYRL